MNFELVVPFEIICGRDQLRVLVSAQKHFTIDIAVLILLENVNEAMNYTDLKMAFCRKSHKK